MKLRTLLMFLLFTIISFGQTKDTIYCVPGVITVTDSSEILMNVSLIVTHPTKYSVTVQPSPDGTTIPIAGTYTYKKGTSITFTATPNTGYQFDYWTINGEVITTNPITRTVRSNMLVIPYFKVIPPVVYDVIVQSAPNGYTIPSAGTYSYNSGATATFTAVSNTGYQFDHWTVNGVSNMTNPMTISVTSNLTIVPFFSVIPPVTYSVTIQASPNGVTTPTAGTYTYTEGTSVAFTALPNTGYQFDHWTVNGVTVATNPMVRIVNSDLSIIPFFTVIPPVTYLVTVQSASNGTTIPAAGTYTYNSGTSVTFTATASMGYQFDHWTVNGTSVTTNPMVRTITSDLTVIPFFTAIPPVTYSVTIQTSANGVTTPVAGTYTYNSGTSITVTATPNTGYQFTNWTVNGTTVPTNPLVRTVTSNLTIIPYFSVIPPPITGVAYYVDNTATGANNGTSWTNAWKSLSSIVWSSIKPGDVIYISGGTNSKIYYDMLIPQCQGTAAKRITILPGKYAPNPSGHSGRVIIDGGGGARIAGVYFDDYSAGSPRYITVKGLELREATGGVNFNIDDTTLPIAIGIILDSLTIYDWYDLAGVMALGNTDSLIVRNCSLVTFLNDGYQTDCFQFNGTSTQYPRRTFIHDNFIDNRNQDPQAHNDAIQSVLADGFVIYNNIIINDSVYSPEGGGLPFILGAFDNNYSKPISQRYPVILYNNFCYMGGAWYPNANMGYTMWTRYYSDQAHQPLTYILNNTIVTNGPRLAGVGQEYKIDLFINNIDAMYCLPDGVGGENWRSGSTHGWHANFSANSGWSTAMPMDSIRNNLFWKQDNVQTLFVGGYKYTTGGTGGISNWATWISKGGTGKNVDPLFVKNFGKEPSQLLLNGALKPNSPAIDAGENIQPYLNFFYNTWKIVLPNKGINGVDRGTKPTIGAYEY